MITADDFGLSEGINRGILEAFEAGALRSTSAMVGMPAFEDAAARARAAGSALGVGLHLTLTVGRPLTAARSLVDPATGDFLPLPRLLAHALAGRVREADVAAECAAQLARLHTACGRVTHLDGHHHVHVFPGIRDVVHAVARGAGIRVVRRPAEPLWRSPERWRRLPTRIALLALSRAGTRLARDAWHTDRFAGLALYGASRFHAALLRVLDALPCGTTELMVHPGYVDGPLPGDDPYSAEREVELRALTAPDVLARLHDGTIELKHFGEL